MARKTKLQELREINDRHRKQTEVVAELELPSELLDAIKDYLWVSTMPMSDCTMGEALTKEVLASLGRESDWDQARMQEALADSDFVAELVQDTRDEAARVVAHREWQKANPM